MNPCNGTLTIVVTATPTNGTVPLNVTLTSRVSGGCPGYNVSWALGDGTFALGPSVNHTYRSAGQFFVWGRVVDSENHSALGGAIITVFGGNGNITVAVTASPLTGPTPLGVTCWANVTGTNATNLSTTWSFGDGGFGRGSIVTHEYYLAGNFTIVALVWEGTRPEAQGTVRVSILPGTGALPANLSIVAEPVAAPAPDNVSLLAYSNGFGDPTGLLVCWGDGSPCASSPAAAVGAGPIPFTHRYAMPGNFSVVATLFGPFGSVLAGASTAVVVTSNPPLEVNVTAEPQLGVTPLVMTYSVSVSGGAPPYSIQWSFGDGAWGSSVPGLPISHTYPAVGTYYPRVIVSDSAGHVDNVSVTPVVVKPTVSTASAPAGGGISPAMVNLLAVLAAGVVGGAIGRWWPRGSRRQKLREEGEVIVRELQGRR